MILTLLFLTYSIADEINISLMERIKSNIPVKKIMTKAYSELSIRVNYIPHDDTTAIEQANKGITHGSLQRIDALESLYPNLVQIPVPINYIDIVLLTKKENRNLDIKTWASLEKYKTGIMAGHQYAIARTEGYSVKFYKDYDNAFKSIANGEIDFLVFPKIEAMFHLKKNPTSTLGIHSHTLERYFLYHYLHKSKKHLKPKLEKVLKKLLIKGYIQKARINFTKTLNE